MKKIHILMFIFLAVLGICAVRTVYLSVSGTADKGKYVIIDAGHGGIDSGKVGVNGVLEKDLNLEIARKLEKLLKKAGYRVTLTRTEDIGLYEEGSGSKKAEDLKNRCILINEEEPDLAVSIHQNSYTDASVHGAQVFYFTHSAEAEAMAQVFQQCLCEIDPSNTRMAKANDTYYLLKKTEVPVVIAECGFLSNPAEAEKLTDEAYQDKIAEALCKSVRKCLAGQNGSDY